MELDSCLTAPANWQRRTIGAVCERFTSGGTPSRARPEFYGGRIPWVKTKELGDKTLWGAEEHITEAGLASSSAKLLPAGTVLMAMYGATVAKLGRLGMPMACNQACAAMVVDSDLADASYLFYQLKLNRAKIVSSASGAAQQNLSGQQIKNFILPFPDMREQHLIGGLLGSLDEKIELNRRTNETLEAMAQAIFRDWLVDFGPVRRKMQGATDPVAIMGGLSPDANRAAELTALFPDAFGDSQLPDGWRPGTLGDLAKTAGEGVRPEQMNPDTAYIGLEHMPRRSIALSEWEGVGKVTSQKARFARGQVLFGKLRPYFHKVGVAPLDGVCSTDIVVLESKAPFDRPFVLCCASSDEFVTFNDQASTGTKMPRTSWAVMRGFDVAVAPDDVRQAFSGLVQPMIDRILAAVAESRTLAETRDYLLPRLMSGKVRVGDAAREIEAASA